MEPNIKEVYEKHKNLKLAADELGMKWQTLYVKLKQAGIPVTGEKLRYGSDKDKLAAQSEIEFKKLVPFAECQNEIKYQSSFDYRVGDFKIDIKASRPHQGNKKYAATRWSFSTKKQEFCADFIVCFAMTDDGYRIFLIPGECVRKYMTISISTNDASKSKWRQYEVSPDELSEFFESFNTD